MASVNFHDANGDERGIAHGTWAAVHGRGIVCESLREGRRALVLKLKDKLKIS